ncbi:MAG: hypothetical protein V2I33_25880, partial [Kangiellaceae bacterium]|nr:hypothetical protein [Kangiellaceae bacterium]
MTFRSTSQRMLTQSLRMKPHVRQGVGLMPMTDIQLRRAAPMDATIAAFELTARRVLVEVRIAISARIVSVLTVTRTIHVRPLHVAQMQQ